MIKYTNTGNFSVIIHQVTRVKLKLLLKMRC